MILGIVGIGRALISRPNFHIAKKQKDSGIEALQNFTAGWSGGRLEREICHGYLKAGMFLVNDRNVTIQ